MTKLIVSAILRTCLKAVLKEINEGANWVNLVQERDE